MSVCIIRAYRSIDNILLLFQFPATEPDGSMAGILQPPKSLWRDDGGFCFARSQAARIEVRHD